MPKSDQGIDQKRYQVVPRTLIFLFDSNSRVLLLKGSPQKRLWAGLFNGIGGHIERGEDVLEAAKRELFEETGIAGVTLQYCAQIMVDVSEELGVAIFVFRGKLNNSNFEISSEGSLSWVALDALATVPIVEDLPTLIPRIAAHQVNSPTIFGKYTYDLDGNLLISLS
jgi:8-oxo-dGTP diphosphatase